jgi:chitodextrinase
MTDTLGNVTRSEIQQVFVGAGRYKTVSGGSGYAEDINGPVNGVYPFLVVDSTPPSPPGAPVAGQLTDRSVTLTWQAATDNIAVTGYKVFRNGAQVASPTSASYTDSGLAPSTAYSYTVTAFDAAGNQSSASAALGVTTRAADMLAPTAPGQPAASNVTQTGVMLAWTAATDNYGVANYLVLRNGVQVGAATSTSYSDSGLAPSTTYSYTIKAQDAAGNTGPASAARTVTTAAGNVATVYYRLPSGWNSANIHYSPTGGTWTTVPGVAMAAACTGWMSYTANLSNATGMQAVFNNGAGTWDNNGGKNYTLGTGLSRVENGVVSTGANPCDIDTTAPTAPTALAAGNVSATAVTVSWGASSDNVGVTGYYVYRNGALLGTTTGTSYADNTAAPATTYSYTVMAFDAAGNASAPSSALQVTTPAASGCQVSFTIANANTVVGQNLYVVGNNANLGNWTPASGFALAIQGSGANVPWTGTVSLPAGASIQYKYVKWNGSTAVWESNQATASGNREFALPASCSGTVLRSDGNFKF